MISLKGTFKQGELIILTDYPCQLIYIYIYINIYDMCNTATVVVHAVKTCEIIYVVTVLGISLTAK